MERFPTLYWVYHFLFSHLTLRLCALGVLIVMPTLFLLWSGFGGAGFRVSFAAMGAVAASMLLGLWALPRRLRLSCEMPQRVEAGSRFTIRYHLHNEGRRAVRDLVVEALIYSDYFQYRLRRPALQWLAPGNATTLEGGGRALVRGVYTLPALRWDSSFPLGFWRWGKSDRRERVLHIYPSYQRLLNLEMPLGPRWQTELRASAEPTREALEFASCREYRVGDALRHIHPRSSARLGVPVVKEFQTTGRSRTAVLVDTRGRRAGWREVGLRLGRVDMLEAALSLTAAVVEAISRSDNILELLIAGPTVHRFISSGRSSYFEEVLDILAGIEPANDDPLARLGPVLLDEIRAIQSVCLILTGWDERRAKLVGELQAWEVGLKVVLLTPSGKRPVALPDEVEVVSALAVQKGEVAEL